MSTITARRPTIADAMIACAGIGLWFGIVRATVPIGDIPSRPMQALFGLEAVVLAGLGSAGVALLAIRLVPPRPPIRRLALEPGFAACASSVAASVVLGVSALAMSLDGLNSMGLIEGFAHCVGFAVGGAWLILALGGLWRPARDWLERSGRVLGIAWIGCPIAYRIALFVSLR